MAAAAVVKACATAKWRAIYTNINWVLCFSLLLTAEEDVYYENRFNIDLLTQRLISVTRWLEKRAEAHGLPIGYFGASTGAASALRAAAQLPEVKCVVSRGGRPDLAMDALHAVKAAVLLIVGALDTEVLHWNERALQLLPCEKELLVLEGATHLFEEPGKMEAVANVAAAWFEHHLFTSHATAPL